MLKNNKVAMALWDITKMLLLGMLVVFALRYISLAVYLFVILWSWCFMLAVFRKAQR